MNESYKMLTIEAANEGGFVVISDRPEPGFSRGLLFAGALDDCLAYIERRMRPAVKQPEFVEA